MAKNKTSKVFLMIYYYLGLYPEGHQIVDNHMVDRETMEVF